MALTLFIALATVFFLGASQAKDCSYTTRGGTFIEKDCPDEDCCGDDTYKYCCPSTSSPPIKFNVGNAVNTFATIWIVLIVVGCVVFLAIVIGIILCCCCCCKKAASSSRGNPGVIYQPQAGKGQPNMAYTPGYAQGPTSNPAYPTNLTPPDNTQKAMRM